MVGLSLATQQGNATVLELHQLSSRSCRRNQFVARWVAREASGLLLLSVQDGKLTTEEMLRSLVLDGAVSEDAVDADVFAVFDK